MGLLDSKTTLITGATRGIGRQIALEFAREGAKVAFTYLSSPEQAIELEAELRALGADVLHYKADATDNATTETLINDIVSKWGGLEVVVNNAGITQDNLLLRMSEEQFDAVIKTNLYSVFYTTRAVLKSMLRQRKGSIINISSVVGITGNAGQANYSASKAGMIGFTQSTAKEVASRNIRANCIAPGFIETEMTRKIPEADLQNWLKNVPLGRAGQGIEVAKACVFLASDMSSYITGQVIQVDGGMVMG